MLFPTIKYLANVKNLLGEILINPLNKFQLICHKNPEHIRKRDLRFLVLAHKISHQC